MKFFDYQPGNGTRYPIYLGNATSGSWILTLMWKGGSGGTAFKWSQGISVDASYLMEKLALNHRADAAALLAFIRDETGTEVYMPQDFSEQGLWAPETQSQP